METTTIGALAAMTVLSVIYLMRRRARLAKED